MAGDGLELDADLVEDSCISEMNCRRDVAGDAGGGGDGTKGTLVSEDAPDADADAESNDAEGSSVLADVLVTGWTGEGETSEDEPFSPRSRLVPWMTSPNPNGVHTQRRMEEGEEDDDDDECGVDICVGVCEEG